MPIYQSLGSIPHKRHTAHYTSNRELCHEELIGNYGFNGPSSLVYHLRPPTSVKSTRIIAPPEQKPELEPTFALRHFRTDELKKGGSATLDRTTVLYNEDVTISHVFPDTQDEHFYRNGGADELLFVAQGEGILRSPFGALQYKQGDQLIIPRGVLYRLEMGDLPHRLMVVESRGYMSTPTKYRTEFGQLKEGAPFSERAIRRPTWSDPIDKKGDYKTIVKHPRGFSEVIQDHHPFDVVGWDGYYYPWAFNIREFEPIVGAVHQPPPVHQVLQGEGFVYCNFCPRPFDFHPEAVPAPYNHTNVMSDEVLIYVSEEFMSRKGIGYGSITLHPDGMPHGPHPGRYESSMGKTETNEFALMVDTFRPLNVSLGALQIEDRDYYKSWIEAPK